MKNNTERERGGRKRELIKTGKTQTSLRKKIIWELREQTSAREGVIDELEVWELRKKEQWYIDLIDW